MPSPVSRPPRGSRKGKSVPRRPPDADAGLPARELPCAWCGLRNSVYADKLAPWADKCWHCYDSPSLDRGPRDRRLHASSQRRLLASRRKTVALDALDQLLADQVAVPPRLAARVRAAGLARIEPALGGLPPERAGWPEVAAATLATLQAENADLKLQLAARDRAPQPEVAAALAKLEVEVADVKRRLAEREALWSTLDELDGG